LISSSKVSYRSSTTKRSKLY